MRIWWNMYSKYDCWILIEICCWMWLCGVLYGWDIVIELWFMGYFSCCTIINHWEISTESTSSNWDNWM